MITWTTIAVWTISAVLAAGIGWSRYEKKKTRDKYLAQLAAMEREDRERLLLRLNPSLQKSAPAIDAALWAELTIPPASAVR
jgi:hypothetical protein